MADTLFPAAGQLLEGAANTNTQTNDLLQKQKQLTSNQGQSAGSEVGANERQMSSQEAAQKLKQMELQDTINITPQIALGLAKNTGDPSWMQAVGTPIRPDVMLVLYTHGMAVNNSKKSPKVTQVYDADGKVRHAVVYTDEEGNVQQHVIDEGMTPEKLHPGKPGAAKDTSQKKSEAFMKAHEKQAALFNNASASQQLKATDPEQWNREHEEYLKDQDRYDQLKTSMGTGGGSPAPAAAPAQGADDQAPFDVHEFLQSVPGLSK